MRSNRWALVAICLATFMLLLDITIVQVALPSMQRHFHAGLPSIQWIVDAYALTLSALIVAAGRLADQVGRRRVFASGVMVFSAASVLCGLAPTIEMVDAARALQGVGGAAMFATALALIGQQFTGAERGRAIATWGSTVGAGVAAGPPVGGLLVNALDWRWVFLVNAPIGLATVLLTRRAVTEGRDPQARRVDVPSLVAFSAGLGLVVAGLLRGAEQHWSTPFGAVAGAAGVGLLLGFAWRQRRDDSLFGPELFRSRPFRGVSLATLSLGAGMFAMLLYLTLFLQNVLGYSALGAGLRLLPMTGLIFAVPLVMRRLRVQVVSTSVVAGGLFVTGVGLVLLTAGGATTSWARLVPGLVFCGVGVGMANPAIAATGLAVVAPTRTGLAAGISNTCRIAGLAVGVALLGAILDNRVAAGLGATTHPHAATLVAAGQLHAAATAMGGGPHALLAAASTFTSALHAILWVGGALVFAGSAAAFRASRGLRQVAQVVTPATSTSAAA